MALNTPLCSPFLQTKDFCATMIKYFSAGTKNEGLGYSKCFVFNRKRDRDVT